MTENNPWDAWEDDREVESFEQSQLEVRLKSAANFVQPSEFFRARILDDARQWQADRATDHHFLRAVLAVACTVALTIASLHSLNELWGRRYEESPSSQIQARANRIASEKRLSIDDSLTDAFWESRAELAARWIQHGNSATP